MAVRALRLMGTAATAILLATIALGVAYPLLVTGAAQLIAPNRADGSLVRVDGRVVGSRLAAQAFTSPGYFQPRASASGYDPSATTFANLGPNTRALGREVAGRLAQVLRRERPYLPGLRAADLPADMVTTTGSGIDPHITPRNARIQAVRVAAVRGLGVEEVLRAVEDHTDGRFAGVLGEAGVNVLELNLALDARTGPPRP
ncbi:MAG: K(+)-transporting ATPase subunit C [Thermoleophilia bacterium]|jgi:K+-transporting ATPase ATPase C chain|nr:K(+)-transporting ATPase subunit C [Thermoleophilia bacterium]